MKEKNWNNVPACLDKTLREIVEAMKAVRVFVTGISQVIFALAQGAEHKTKIHHKYVNYVRGDLENIVM